MGKAAKLVAGLIAFAAMASANSILFGLAGDPNQNYTFIRTDTPIAGSEYPGMSVTVPAGPYSGWLGQNIPADDAYFVCISFTKTSTFGSSYLGSTTGLSTPAQLEAAYLAAELVSFGTQNATLAQKGAISMAIWQLTDPTPGDVPRDPAAQAYVTSALNAYNSGHLTAADFPNSVIFIPNNNSIQSFLELTPSSPGFATLQAEMSGAPEPASIVLILAGLAMMVLGRVRLGKRKSA